MYSFVNDLPEDGLYEPKHIGEASQNKIYLWLHVQFFLLNTAKNSSIFYLSDLNWTLFEKQILVYILCIYLTTLWVSECV